MATALTRSVFVDAGAVSLKNTNDSGPPDVTYDRGQSVWTPVSGIWAEGGHSSIAPERVPQTPTARAADFPREGVTRALR